MAPILVTGASGNVGSAVLRTLTANGAVARVAGRLGRTAEGRPDNVVAFDFTDPGTWSAAFEGVESMFLMRPRRSAMYAATCCTQSRPLGTPAYAMSCSCPCKGRRGTRSCRTPPWRIGCDPRAWCGRSYARRSSTRTSPPPTRPIFATATRSSSRPATGRPRLWTPRTSGRSPRRHSSTRPPTP